jgi:glycopeptide antibiotics resistance protein
MMPDLPDRLLRLRICYAVLLALSLLFTLYEELHLRRWLFHHPGVGSLVAGSLPNFLAVVVLGFGVAMLKPAATERETLRSVVTIVLGLTLYEFAQIWMPHQVFDWNDIAASVLGGIFVWLLIQIARRGLQMVAATQPAELRER